MENFRIQMVAACQWLSQRGYAAGDDAAISQRLDSGRFLITPRERSLQWLSREELVLLDMDGQRLEGALDPALALELHVTVYGQRDDAGAVILAQPPSATAFAIAGIPLVQPIIPEMVLTVGSVPLAPYTTPYSPKAADIIEQLLNEHDALLLKSRGLLVLGPNLIMALEKLERIENMATAMLGAKVLGHVNILTGAHVKELMMLRERLKLPGKNHWVLSNGEKNDA